MYADESDLLDSDIEKDLQNVDIKSSHSDSVDLNTSHLIEDYLDNLYQTVHHYGGTITAISNGQYLFIGMSNGKILQFNKLSSFELVSELTSNDLPNEPISYLDQNTFSTRLLSIHKTGNVLFWNVQNPDFEKKLTSSQASESSLNIKDRMKSIQNFKDRFYKRKNHVLRMITDFGEEQFPISCQISSINYFSILLDAFGCVHKLIFKRNITGRSYESMRIFSDKLNPICVIRTLKNYFSLDSFKGNESVSDKSSLSFLNGLKKSQTQFSPQSLELFGLFAMASMDNLYVCRLKPEFSICYKKKISGFFKPSLAWRWYDSKFSSKQPYTSCALLACSFKTTLLVIGVSTKFRPLKKNSSMSMNELDQDTVGLETFEDNSGDKMEIKLHFTTLYNFNLNFILVGVDWLDEITLVGFDTNGHLREIDLSEEKSVKPMQSKTPMGIFMTEAIGEVILANDNLPAFRKEIVSQIFENSYSSDLIGNFICASNSNLLSVTNEKFIERIERFKNDPKSQTLSSLINEYLFRVKQYCQINQLTGHCRPCQTKSNDTSTQTQRECITELLFKTIIYVQTFPHSPSETEEPSFKLTDKQVNNLLMTLLKLDECYWIEEYLVPCIMGDNSVNLVYKSIIDNLLRSRVYIHSTDFVFSSPFIKKLLEYSLLLSKEYTSAEANGVSSLLKGQICLDLITKIKFDKTNLDSILNFCWNNELYTSYIHLYTVELNDYLTPLRRFIDRIAYLSLREAVEEREDLISIKEASVILIELAWTGDLRNSLDEQCTIANQVFEECFKPPPDDYANVVSSTFSSNFLLRQLTNEIDISVHFLNCLKISIGSSQTSLLFNDKETFGLHRRYQLLLNLSSCIITNLNESQTNEDTFFNFTLLLYFINLIAYTIRKVADKSIPIIDHCCLLQILGELSLAYQRLNEQIPYPFKLIQLYNMDLSCHLLETFCEALAIDKKYGSISTIPLNQDMETILMNLFKSKDFKEEQSKEVFMKLSSLDIFVWQNNATGDMTSFMQQVKMDLESFLWLLSCSKLKSNPWKTSTDRLSTIIQVACSDSLIKESRYELSWHHFSSQAVRELTKSLKRMNKEELMRLLSENILTILIINRDWLVSYVNEHLAREDPAKAFQVLLKKNDHLSNFILLSYCYEKTSKLKAMMNFVEEDDEDAIKFSIHFPLCLDEARSDQLIDSCILLSKLPNRHVDQFLTEFLLENTLYSSQKILQKIESAVLNDNKRKVELQGYIHERDENYKSALTIYKTLLNNELDHGSDEKQVEWYIQRMTNVLSKSCVAGEVNRNLDLWMSLINIFSSHFNGKSEKYQKYISDCILRVIHSATAHVSLAQLIKAILFTSNDDRILLNDREKDEKGLIKNLNLGNDAFIFKLINRCQEEMFLWKTGKKTTEMEQARLHLSYLRNECLHGTKMRRIGISQKCFICNRSALAFAGGGNIREIVYLRCKHVCHTSCLRSVEGEEYPQHFKCRICTEDEATAKTGQPNRMDNYREHAACRDYFEKVDAEILEVATLDSFINWLDYVRDPDRILCSQSR